MLSGQAVGGAARRDPIAGKGVGVLTYCAGAAAAPTPDHGPELRCGAAILHQVSWSEVWYEVSARGGSVAGRLDSAQGKQGQTLISSPRCYFISREL